MKENLLEFTDEEKYLVKELYEEGYTVSEISEIMKLTFNETIAILVRVMDGLDLVKLMAFDTISDDKVLILSDTHLGSVYENMEYLKMAYQYAKEQDIHVAFHAGDLIQSTFRNVQDQYQDERKQLRHVQRDYPSSDIKNYILLGNHDYNTLKKDSYYYELLDERDDFYLMGFKRAYISWRDYLFSMYHTIKKYHVPIPNIESTLNFKGHSHKLSYKKLKSIDVPTLSDDLLYHGKAKPGFLIGTIHSDILQIESFYFKNESLYQEKNPILIRKI